MKQQFLRRALGGALSIGLLMQPALAAVTPDIPQGWTTPFSDVAEGDWYTPFVSTLNSQGVINGYDDGRFGPNDAVKAGDAILMVVKAAGSGDQPAPEGGHYAAGYVQYALDHGWLTQSQAAVDLNAPASRLTIAQLAAKALGLSASTKSSPFADTSDGYVTALYQNGVVVGEKSGSKRYFKPNDSITRAELINILSNMVDTLVKETTTVTENVSGSLLISAADGATLKGIRIGGDLILAPGVTKDVTLVDCVIQGNIRNYGTGEVRFEAPQITPESTATKPSEVYKPGATLDRTLEYGGKTVPIYRDRPLNVFSDVDFIWTDEENENQRRLEYLGGEFRTRYGIDVSSFQGEIDWDAVADDNIDFAMVRVGFRGTGTGSLNTDKYYEQNIRGAMRAGLETGVYFFAQAVTVEEAIEEADYVISLLDGLDINGPVAYDWEMHDSTYRVYGTSPEMATACAVAFCERIKDAGYTPMVYGGTYVTYMKYDQGALADYLSWYPEYKSEKSEKLCPTLVYHMDYWQFSSSCSIDGIGGKVDANIQFIR